ncbi:maleylpyruvate isomerase family mycothiol-dependent enzyme [Kitasatospora kazusensis]|uniref:Maleylpyruvate isomerase family mycothiol-dependent enzyme n=2 Tax=Kitasatospora kazusensis TaxID=407974 RepID=A0ABP5KPW0_9ACTN
MYALRRDGARLAEAAAGHLAAPVPSCPEWTVADLVGHTGAVHRFWTAVGSGELTDPSGYAPLPRPAEDGLIEWFTEGLELCAATLETLDPELPRWTWSDRKDVGFIQRRMAQEQAVHTWDGLAAAGRDEPVEPALAADGVDEFLAHFARAKETAGLPEAGLHLHATDGPGEWWIRPADGGWRVDREHGKGAVAVRGTRSDLLLLLWRRRGADQLETFGDLAVLEDFLSAFSRG